MKFSLTNRFRNPLPLCLVAAMFVFGIPAFALTGTWTSTTGGNWEDATTAPWSGGTVAGGAGFSANFTSDITAATTVTLTANRTIGNVTINDTGSTGDSNWIIAASGGSVLTLDNGASDAVITKTSSGTISAQLASTGTVSIVGGGNLTLSGDNTGLTGTVKVGGTNTVTLGSNTALGTAAVQIVGQPAIAFNSAFTLASSISYSGDGSKIWTAGSNNLLFSGTQTVNTTNQGIMLWGRSATFSNQLILGANNFNIESSTSSALELSLTGVVSGTGKLVKNGATTTLNLTGSNANTFSGGITFNAGTIRVGNNNAALGTGVLTVATATANASTTNLLATSNGGGARTLANNIVITNNGTGTTTLQLDGGWADLNLSGGISGTGGISTTSSGTIRITGTNSYTGSTVLAGTNTLILSGSNTTSGITIGSGNTLALRQITLSANISGAGKLQKDGAFFGTAVLSGNNTYSGSTTVNIDWLRIASGGIVNGTSGITVQGQWSSRFDNLGTVTTSGAVAVDGYAGSGTASDSGVFYNGNLAGTTPGSLTAASITLGSSFRSAAAGLAKGGEFFNHTGSSVSLGSGGITINGQGNSLAGGMLSAGSQFSNAGTVTAGFVTLNSSTTANTVANKGGTYTQTAGSTTLSGALTLSANGGYGAAGTAGNDAGFNLTGGSFTANTIAVNAGNLSASAGTLNANSMSVGSGAVLTVSGTAQVNGPVAMASGSKLTGNGGLFNANVTINGVHAPGDSPGLQTFASGLTYGSTSTLNAEFVGDTLGIRGTNYDGINVTGGNLTIDLSSILNLIGTGIDYTAALWDSNRAFTIIDFTSAGTSSGIFSLDTSSAGSFAGEGSWALAKSSGDVVLNWTAVPEPASALLGGLGMLLLLRRRR